MQSTLSLLDRALSAGVSAAELARRIGVPRSAISNAKAKGHLTPVIAGGVALEIGEDPRDWMTLAVIEGEKPSPAKDRLAKRLLQRMKKL